MAKTLIWAVVLGIALIFVASSGPTTQAQLMRLPEPHLTLDPIQEDSVLIDDGRIPVLGPITITEPGDYSLVRDLEVSDTAVTIESDDVTLDLNGHTIRSQPGALCSGIPNASLIAFTGSRIIIRNWRDPQKLVHLRLGRVG